VGGGRSQVGSDQRGFQIVEGGAVDLLAESNSFLDALAEVLPGARHRFLHALQEAGLLLEAAEKGLDHKEEVPFPYLRRSVAISEPRALAAQPTAAVAASAFQL
jgi:hypothetical protein